MENLKYCYCKGCQYNDSHVTAHHRCEKCKYFGHGIAECKSLTERKKLFNNFILSNKIKLPIEKHCKILNCLVPHLHSTESHYDIFINNEYAYLINTAHFNHINSINFFYNLDKKLLKSIKNRPNTYTFGNIGQGYYIAMRNKNNIIDKKKFDYCNNGDDFKSFIQGLILVK